MGVCCRAWLTNLKSRLGLPQGDNGQLPFRVAARYRPHMGHFYKFKRGDRVRIVAGKHVESEGWVESAVFQRTVDYPDQFAPGYHVVLDDERVVTVRWDQINLT